MFRVFLSIAALTVSASVSTASAMTDAPRAGASINVEVEKVVSGLRHPWGLAFLPDRAMLVTERQGRLIHVGTDGTVQEVAGVPEVAASGQGGLLDVTTHPGFSANRLVYLSYAEPGDGGSSTAVARGRLADNGAGLDNVEVIFSQTPKIRSSRHFGSRLVFANDGTLFVTLGDRAARPEAQNPQNHIGTVVRINDDGSVPSDNPFLGDPSTLDTIYSLGHRNIQGADLDADGRLWTVEHGARGGDELNLPQAGQNYGWPTISYGRHYSGGRIGEGTEAPGLEQPVYYWDPSIAPSGLAVVDGDLFAAWQGNILIGALKDQLLSRLVLEGDTVVAEEILLEREIGRIREVEMGPDGAIYLLTDEGSGGVYRLTPSS
ncbi:MAG: PQQ-dependent sugar dehydrogenase [Devosia sp.]